METRIRSLTKALSWQVLGLFSMSILGFLFTGSLASGGALALVSAGVGFVTYLGHERLWQGIQWGRRAADTMTRGTAPGDGRTPVA